MEWNGMDGNGPNGMEWTPWTWNGRNGGRSLRADWEPLHRRRRRTRRADRNLMLVCWWWWIDREVSLLCKASAGVEDLPGSWMAGKMTPEQLEENAVSHRLRTPKV